MFSNNRGIELREEEGSDTEILMQGRAAANRYLASLPRYMSVRGQFPQNHVVELKYRDYHTITAPASTVWNRIYYCNDIKTTANPYGHACNGYDQLTKFYSKWCVVESQLKAWITPETSLDDAVLALQVALQRPGDAYPTTLNLMNVRQEAGNSAFGVFSGQYRPTPITSTFSLFGVMPGIEEPANDCWGTHPYVAPAKKWYWQLVAANLDIPSVTAGKKLFIEVCYKVVFTVDKVLPDS